MAITVEGNTGMTTEKVATKRPRDVKRVTEFRRMESDNNQAYGWSILHNGDHISLHSPKGGTWVEIPKKDFDAIVDAATDNGHRFNEDASLPRRSRDTDAG